MRLNNEGLKNSQEWLNKGYILPKFDRDEMVKNTKNSPVWVHFGPGNIFHAFHAEIVEHRNPRMV